MKRLPLLLLLLLVAIPGSYTYAGDVNNAPDGSDTTPVLRKLASFLNTSKRKRGPVAKQAFSKTPLSQKQAMRAKQLLWRDFVERRRKNMPLFIQKQDGPIDAGVVKTKKKQMKFLFREFGEKPERGRRLWISLHGGGDAPPKVNKQQWMNQIKLYKPDEGIYVAPHAPTDKWDMWFRPHMDALYDRLITNMVIARDVNPNRVYLMGFSAGGDGTYQIGARMADRWAAAAMMAGHPNDTSPLNFRNVPFTIHVGGKDSAYDRNKKAREWKKKLYKLEETDSGGYEHWVPSYPNKGHWLDREDARALDWMAKFERNPVPKRVVWVQDDVTHSRRFWLEVDEENEVEGSKVFAYYENRIIRIQKHEKVNRLRVLLSDRMMNLDRKIRIVAGGKKVFQGKVPRTIATIADTLRGRYDPQLMFSASVTVELP